MKPVSPGSGFPKSGSPRLGNLILLIGGYGFGQGSIFLAQTWLISRGQLGLVADFGVNFYVATLAIMLVDFGSTAVLARETAAAQHARTLKPVAGQSAAAGRLWTDFWAIFPARALMAVAVVVAGATAVAMTGDVFARAYAVWAWPALIVWAFNATGVLDGLRLSGMNGVAGALPFVTSGVSLAAVADQPPAIAGAVLGAALSAGYLLAVAGQMLALRRAGHAPRWDRPASPAVVQAARSGFAALLSTLPGQIYFRFQILLARVFLGEAGVALFLYAKQIVVGLAQLIGFLRRIEFPDLVQRLSEVSSGYLKETVKVQRVGTGTAAACAVMMSVAGLSVWRFSTGDLAKAGWAAALFGPVVFTSALALGSIQALYATRRYGRAAVINIAAVCIGAVMMSYLSYIPELAFLAAADVGVNLVAIGLTVYALRSPTSSTAGTSKC